MARAFTIMPEQRMLADERRRPARASLAQGACECPMLLETVHVLLDLKIFARRKRFRGAGTLACRVETRLDAWGVSAPRFGCGALPRGAALGLRRPPRPPSSAPSGAEIPRGPRTRATCLPAASATESNHGACPRSLRAPRCQR